MPTCLNSATPKPRVVAAGVPRRIPEVTNGFSGSKGMPFLLQVIAARTSAFSETLPLRPLGRRSTSIRWLSVPPETMSKPWARSDFRQRLGVLDHVLGVDLEVRPQRFGERHRLGRDHMHQGTALQAREDRRIQFLGERFVVAQDQAAARAAQRFVRGGGGDMGMRHRRSMDAAGDEAGEMRHVHQEIGADAVGDLAKTLEVPGTRIGRAAGDDQFWLAPVRPALRLHPYR